MPKIDFAGFAIILEEVRKNLENQRKIMSAITTALASVETSLTTIQAALAGIAADAQSLATQLAAAQNSMTPADAQALANAVAAAEALATSSSAALLTANGLGTPPAPVAGAPVISGELQNTTNLGSDFVYQITASNTPTSFGLTGTLPPGLSFNATTGQITGTSTTVGVWTVTISAINSNGTGSALLTIGVLQD